jgi:MFS family permease
VDPMIKAFGFSIAFSALMIGRLIFQVPLGRLSDRFGRRPFAFLGLILMTPATGLLGEVTSLFQFVMLRFLQGIAAAAIVAAVYLEKDVAEFGSLCYHDWARTFEVNTMGVMRVAEYFALLDTTASHFPGNSQPRRRSFSGVHFSFGLPRG